MDQLQWESWDLLPGAMIPTRESVEAILPGYYDKYNTELRGNYDKYIALLKDRFRQRKDFLLSSDLTERPEIQEKLIQSLQVNAD
jgi:phosphoenolpyruvate carboxykinase (ATP)